MTRRKKTDGERIAKRVFSGRYESRGEAYPSELAVEIDRLVRKRMREAWEAGYNFREVIAEMEAEA
jgi:hypothetical protein